MNELRHSQRIQRSGLIVRGKLLRSLHEQIDSGRRGPDRKATRRHSPTKSVRMFEFKEFLWRCYIFGCTEGSRLGSERATERVNPQGRQRALCLVMCHGTLLVIIIIISRHDQHHDETDARSPLMQSLVSSHRSDGGSDRLSFLNVPVVLVGSEGGPVGPTNTLGMRGEEAVETEDVVVYSLN